MTRLQIDEEYKRLEEHKAKLDEERAQFTAAAFKLGKEREMIQVCGYFAMKII
jgi:hypothetical protein